MEIVRSESAPSAEGTGLPHRVMHEVRLVGRGGQGVVTAGDLLGKAAVHEGRYAQSIPTFGPERRGALSQCTLRISEEEILLKCSSTAPNLILFLDPTIWHHFNVLPGLTEDSVLLFNTTLSPEEVRCALDEKRYGYGLATERTAICTVDATGIALDVLGRPITNTAMMGAFQGASGLLGMASIEEVLEERFGRLGEKNVRAARAARDGLRRL